MIAPVPVELLTTASRLAAVLLLASSLALAQTKRWVLPAVDGDNTPSAPSIHGYLTEASRFGVTVQRDVRGGSTGESAHVRLTSRTKFFTTYGGYYMPEELRSGQYVWVWYVTSKPDEAGIPPRAAVVMLWSTDPTDKPSANTRWSYDK